MACSPGAHLADLVEEHGAAVGRLEQPALLLPRVGERAAFVPEQLALEQLLGKRRTGDVDERSCRPVAVVVNRLGGEVLAGAGLARQQHRGGAARRDTRQQRLDLLHDRRFADDASKPYSRLWLVRSARTSRRNWLVSSAFSTSSATSSRLNGLLT